MALGELVSTGRYSALPSQCSKCWIKIGVSFILGNTRTATSQSNRPGEQAIRPSKPNNQTRCCNRIRGWRVDRKSSEPHPNRFLIHFRIPVSPILKHPPQQVMLLPTIPQWLSRIDFKTMHKRKLGWILFKKKNK